IEDGSYQRIINGDYPRRSTDRDASVSAEARSAANSYKESWERSADPLVGMVRDVAGSAASAGGKLFDTVAERWKNAGGRSGDSGQNGAGPPRGAPAGTPRVPGGRSGRAVPPPLRLARDPAGHEARRDRGAVRHDAVRQPQRQRHHPGREQL